MCEIDRLLLQCRLPTIHRHSIDLLIYVCTAVADSSISPNAARSAGSHWVRTGLCAQAYMSVCMCACVCVYGGARASVRVFLHVCLFHWSILKKIVVFLLIIPVNTCRSKVELFQKCFWTIQ